MKSLAILVVLALLWGVGLLAFADRVARSTPAADPVVADGVVALTGSSSVRIEAATRLLEAGKAKRLLISGVNREVTRKELREVGRGTSRTYDCCVDLGFRAADTQGNARETASWARYYKYRTLIVVTADYHMPRSLLELHAALPGVILRPYPVATAELDSHGWWSKGGQTRRMTLEYCKYLTILGREAILKIGRNPQAQTAAPAPAVPAAKAAP